MKTEILYKKCITQSTYINISFNFKHENHQIMELYGLFFFDVVNIISVNTIGMARYTGISYLKPISFTQS